MATCIFYEFILANRFPESPLYCHNALVFAPDKTVLQSLKEIQTFNFNKVIPPEYADFLQSNIKFYYLDDTAIALNSINGSDYNIIISNAQKIILKERHKEPSDAEKLFGEQTRLPGTTDELDSETDDFLKSINLSDVENININQRFQKNH